MQKLQQFNTISLNYDRLENANFNLILSQQDAFNNDELIALADNECLRAIRRITNHPFNEETLISLLKQKKFLIKQENTQENKQQIKSINNQISKMLFISEYVCVQTDKKSKYKKIGKNGFTLNGEKYIRLLCGAGHARTNRAMFCKQSIYKELDKFMRCGCSDIEIVPAKWNAYYALGSSATHQVETPRICVVADKEIEMEKLVDFVYEQEPQDKIVREYKKLKFNLWDGMGLISPSFANKWSQQLGMDYLPSAFIVRYAFIKGLVCVFDFHKFANEIAKKEIITDIYGTTYNINDIDIILTESQFKMWKGYKDWQSFETISKELGWSWGITKVTDKLGDIKETVLTNYQFLQVLDTIDKDIQELCQPTVDWIKGVCGNDLDKTLLYLLGKIANQDNTFNQWGNISDNFIKALLVKPELIKDSYIQKRILQSINKRINDSYMGRLIINGTYQLILGDPYALCEYVFGVDIKGLLKENEHYNYYWSDKFVDKICGLRSPLTWRAEVNELNLIENDKTKEWYKYLNACTIYNVWGCDNLIMSGHDYDGDGEFFTDNKVFRRCKLNV